MSKDPWIGDVNEDRPGVCCFATEPGEPRCGAPATVHILSESAIYGPVALPTCGHHAPVARTAGLFIAEHPYGLGCSGRASWWRLDGCVPADESGAVT